MRVLSPLEGIADDRETVSILRRRTDAPAPVPSRKRRFSLPGD